MSQIISSSCCKLLLMLCNVSNNRYFQQTPITQSRFFESFPSDFVIAENFFLNSQVTELSRLVSGREQNEDNYVISDAVKNAKKQNES